jgi:hypothetical protein
MASTSNADAPMRSEHHDPAVRRRIAEKVRHYGVALVDVQADGDLNDDQDASILKTQQQTRVQRTVSPTATPVNAAYGRASDSDQSDVKYAFDKLIKTAERRSRIAAKRRQTLVTVLVAVVAAASLATYNR